MVLAQKTQNMIFPNKKLFSAISSLYATVTSCKMLEIYNASITHETEKTTLLVVKIILPIFQPLHYYCYLMQNIRKTQCTNLL